MDFPYTTIVQWGEQYTQTNKQLVEAEIERLTQQNKTDGQLAGKHPFLRQWATQEDAEAWKTYLLTLPDPPEDVKIEYLFTLPDPPEDVKIESNAPE